MVKVRYLRPGKEPREWDQRLLADTDKMIVSSFEFRLQKPFSTFNDRILIESGNYGVMFDLLDRWYNIVKVFDEEKRLKGYYSDIREPPERTEDGYVAKDLFLDYWIDLNGDYVLLDEDEFRSAELPSEIEKKVLEIAEKLEKMIEEDTYPPKYVEEFGLSKDEIGR